MIFPAKRESLCGRDKNALTNNLKVRRKLQKPRYDGDSKVIATVRCEATARLSVGITITVANAYVHGKHITNAEPCYAGLAALVLVSLPIL